MPSRTILLLCLVSIFIGTLVGILDVQLRNPDGESLTTSPRHAEILNSTSAATHLADQDLEREKAEALQALLDEETEVPEQ